MALEVYSFWQLYLLAFGVLYGFVASASLFQFSSSLIWLFRAFFHPLPFASSELHRLKDQLQEATGVVLVKVIFLRPVLNFPAEYPPTFSAAAYASSMPAASSSSVANREVFEFECLDDKLLEDLLDYDGGKNNK